MKKKVGIIISGQIRANSLNPDFTHDSIILDSIKEYFLNEEFINEYEYDIFISTDQIDVDKSKEFFGENLKNINLTESNWYMNNQEIQINQFEYYYNKYIKITEKYEGYEFYPNAVYQYYRMFVAYTMLKKYQLDTNSKYDFFVRIRPDARLTQNIVPIFKLLDENNKYLFIEHEQLLIFNPELEDIFKLIEHYGEYTENIETKKGIYMYLTAGGDLLANNQMMLCPEKQFVDHIYYILLKKNINFFNALYGIKYPSFNLLYRENFTYGHINNDHPIYTNKNYIWNPIHSIEYVKNNIPNDLKIYESRYPIKKYTVLFINHKIKKCGVYQYGTRLFNILKKSVAINFIFCEIENYDEYLKLLENNQYNALFYNYHPCIMNWLNSNNIQRKVKNIGIQHDLTENDIFEITLRLDTTLPERENRYNIPRPIFENVDELLKNYVPCSKEFEEFLNYNEGPDVPIFGSFGFIFNRKRFHKIVEVVCNNYDNAIIKLILTHADTAPSQMEVIEHCNNSLTKTNIKLMITHEFIEELDVLKFLTVNTMNIFMHETHPNAGVSSVPDYALSVKNPIGISNTSWFRHIYSPEIDVEITPINESILKGKSISEKYRDEFSNTRLIEKINTIIINEIL